MNLPPAIKDYRIKARISGAVKRPPLRDTRELADEFGVSAKTLINLLRFNDGPPPRLDHKNSVCKIMWFDPVAVRKWWRNLDSTKKTSHDAK